MPYGRAVSSWRALSGACIAQERAVCQGKYHWIYWGSGLCRFCRLFREGCPTDRDGRNGERRCGFNSIQCPRTCWHGIAGTIGILWRGRDTRRLFCRVLNHWEAGVRSGRSGYAGYALFGRTQTRAKMENLPLYWLWKLCARLSQGDSAVGCVRSAFPGKPRSSADGKRTTLHCLRCVQRGMPIRNRSCVTDAPCSGI